MPMKEVTPYAGSLPPLAAATPGEAAAPETAASPAPEALQSLLNLAFDRSYLSRLSTGMGDQSLPRLGDIAADGLHNESTSALAWRRVTRLPVQPAPDADDFLLLRWQRMLTTLHAWQRRFVIVMLRLGDETSRIKHRGEQANQTRLFFGTCSLGSARENINADIQLEQAVAGEMAGLRLETMSQETDYRAAIRATTAQLEAPLKRLDACGAITGLPSPFAMLGRADLRRGSDQDLDSGLGRLARGLKGPDGHDRNFAVVMIADAVPDATISDVIDRLRAIGESVHPLLRTTFQKSHSKGRSQRDASLAQSLRTFAMTITAGVAVKTLASAAASSVAWPVMAGMALTQLNSLLTSGASRSETTGETEGKEQIDMVAQHCKLLVEEHIKRLMRGRSVGFWNTGIYVLGESDDTVSTVCGMLRAAYSGAASHIEPVRSILFPRHLEANRFVAQFRHIPFAPAAATNGNAPAGMEPEAANPPGEWHLLGKIYQNVSTPLTTEELSIATELPRHDAPGLRTAKNLVRFALNGPILPESAKPITLGKIMGSGAVELGDYKFDLNSLVRHGLLVGTTGSGKSTTCRRLIAEAGNAGVNFLIIEPVKDDYARWAIEKNKSLPEGKKIAVYMPGTDNFDGEKVHPLELNPFEPACRKGPDKKTPLRNQDNLGHLERVSSILNASMPMQEALPILLEGAVMHLGKKCFGHKFEGWPDNGEFPLLEELKKSAAVDLFGSEDRHDPKKPARYDARVRENLYAALESRIDSLIRGRRGQTLQVKNSTPADELFERPAIVNLSRFGGEADRALVMALLLVNMCEYRMDCYSCDQTYQDQARNGRLFHLAVVEEAHTVLRRPDPTFAGAGNSQAVVARMFSDMLAEVRQYGQGLLVIDQDPSQLIPGTIKNTSFRIAHKLPHQEDRAALAASMMLRADQAGFLAVLPPGQAVILTELDDAPCWIQMERQP